MNAKRIVGERIADNLPSCTADDNRLGFRQRSQSSCNTGHVAHNGMPFTGNVRHHFLGDDDAGMDTDAKIDDQILRFLQPFLQLNDF